MALLLEAPKAALPAPPGVRCAAAYSLRAGVHPLPSVRPDLPGMGGRKKASRSSSSSGSESGDSDDENIQPTQWVVAIVARVMTDDGRMFYLVRWGADDNGKPSDLILDPRVVN